MLPKRTWYLRSGAKVHINPIALICVSLILLTVLVQAITGQGNLIPVLLLGVVGGAILVGSLLLGT